MGGCRTSSQREVFNKRMNERDVETKVSESLFKAGSNGRSINPTRSTMGKKIQNDIKQRADISEGEDTDGDDEAEEEYVDEPQEGTEDDVQQDALDDAVLLTPMVATAAARRPKSNSSVFKAPMLRVGTRSQVDPFENVMKYIMKKYLELKIVKQEDGKRREREREERRNDEERRYQLMFMQAQQAQQQTNAILQHLVNMSNTTTYPTYPNNNPTTLSSNNNNYPVIDLFTTTGTTGTVYTNAVQQQHDGTTSFTSYTNNMQQQHTSYTNIVHQRNEMVQTTRTYESPSTNESSSTNAVFSPPTVTTDETKVAEEEQTPRVPKRTTGRYTRSSSEKKRRRCMDDFPPEFE